MLLLTTTSDKLQIISGSTGTLDVHASWADLASGVVTMGRTNTNITTATTTDVVAAPAASTTRNIKALYIANNHATNSMLITVQHTDGTHVIPLEVVTLLAGERLDFVEGIGFQLIDSTGIIKSNVPVSAGQYTVKGLSADLTNATTTAAKVTNLDLALGVGTWVFEYFLLWRSDTTTTGIKFGCNHTGTVTFFCYDMYGMTADITTNTALMDQDVLLTTGATMSGWAARAKTTTAPMIASGVDTINLDQLMFIAGIAVVTVAGNLELYHASEAATTTTVKAQSALRATRIS